LLNTLYRESSYTVHRLSKKFTSSAHDNFAIHEWILIIFGRTVTEKIRNQICWWW